MHHTCWLVFNPSSTKWGQLVTNDSLFSQEQNFSEQDVLLVSLSDFI